MHELLVFDRNTLNHTNECKQMIIDKKVESLTIPINIEIIVTIKIKYLKMNHILAVDKPLEIDMPLNK